ncbi:MAG: hypothetical protein J6M92_16010 [Oribacterium sp.]|nr:hypothetical protein [Oribacterium sp.]
MENEKGVVKLSRRQLYNDIWNLSVAGVARKYNLHYGRLIGSCKEADIPYPASGYWTRKNLGKDVSSEIVPLIGDEDILVELATNNSVIKRIKKAKNEEINIEGKQVEDSPESAPFFVENNKDSEGTALEENAKENTIIPELVGVLDFLEQDERERVLSVAYSLEVNENTRLHKALVQYKKRISEYTAKLKNAQKQTYYNPRYNKPDNEPEFFREVSENGMSRLMAILDAVFKAVEKLGGSVNDDLSVRIRSDVVRIRVAESEDKVKHELTKKEAQELIQYEDEAKRNKWASKPRIRQFDYVYNGRIRIVFGEKNYIRDSENEKLEDRLGDILIALYEKSEDNRIARERREEEQRRREEEARRKEELRRRKEAEITRIKELINKADDYRIASDIRAYINAAVESGSEEATSEWIEWAQKKADWYDPTIAREDEYLGRRDHGKSKDEKDLDRVSVGRRWGW